MNYKWHFLGILSILLPNYCIAGDVEVSFPQQNTILFVHPNSIPQSKNSISTPFATIQQAIDVAHPGDTVILMPGEYFQDMHSVRSGQPGRPIRIEGMPGAIIKGGGKTSIFEIRHNYIELSHFVIDGLFSDSHKPEGYRKKLVYIKGLKNREVRSVKLLFMEIKNARDECIRIKYQAKYNIIAYSHISYCGAQDYKFDDGSKNHNGEGIYIGTAPEQIAEGKNPTFDIDQSDHNWIHHNLIETYGSECVDVKEGSSFNIIENNICKYEKDLNVGGISIRGNNNVVRYNYVSSNLGAGIRLGGDTVNDGINNEVYGNYLADNKNSGLKIMREPQNKVCDNTITTLKGQKSIRVRKNMNWEIYKRMCEK